MKDNNNFNYTYSAPAQEEIDKIREKYMPKTETIDKLEQIRRLDKSVETPGIIISLILGIIGTLIFGVGMCCALVWNAMFWGIVVGIIGAIILGIAYPVYKSITAKRTIAMAPQILKLTEELRK